MNAAVDLRTINLCTPLHFAVSTGQPLVIQLICSSAFKISTLFVSDCFEYVVDSGGFFFEAAFGWFSSLCFSDVGLAFGVSGVVFWTRSGSKARTNECMC